MKRTKKEQERQAREKRYAEARVIVAKGKCPKCGHPLYRNNSMSGWWQCEGYPSASHRHPGYENLRECDFQVFTE